MAFKIATNDDDVPRPTRKKRRILMDIPEWNQLRAKLADGLRPYETAVITFNAEDRAKYKIKTLKRVFRDMVKSYIREMHLSYEVDAYSSNGNDVISVKSEPALTKGAG
jgi:hypothetical protein